MVTSTKFWLRWCAGHVTYDKQALQFGPYNLVNRPEAWLTKWQREYDRIAVIMAELADANKPVTPRLITEHHDAT